jgi:hypothetical protein
MTNYSLASLFDVTSTPASYLKFGYAANLSTTVNYNPLVVGLVGNYLDLELPLGTSLNKEFQGNFSVPSSLVQSTYEDITDGNLTIDFPLVSSALGFTGDEPIEDILANFGITIPNSVVEILDALDITDANSAIGVLDNLFDVDLAGSGTLTSGIGSSDFTFNYASDTNSLVIAGLTPSVVAGSLVGESTIAAEGDFTVDLVLTEFLELTTLLGIDLPSDVLLAITLAQTAGINELELASGSFDVDITTIPVSTPLTSSSDTVSAALADSLFSAYMTA